MNTPAQLSDDRSLDVNRSRAVPGALRAALASWRAMSVERLHFGGAGGYLAIWAVRPLFELGIAALIYGAGHPALLRYVVVALAANAFVMNAIFFVGEILDRERVNGTLVGLFLAPCPRASWLSGFALVGLGEAALIAAATLLYGRALYGVRYDPDPAAVAVALTLFLVALWGMGFVFSAVGLVLKKSNQFSNLIYPFVVLLGGVYYPVSLLPAWLRMPARALPFGYGMQALADAALYHRGLRDLMPQLLPLTLFALALPCAGLLAFRLLERLVRERGELDLY